MLSTLSSPVAPQMAPQFVVKTTCGATRYDKVGIMYFIWHHSLPYKHDDVIKCKHFPRYWPFVREIHRHRWIPLTKGQ